MSFARRKSRSSRTSGDVYAIPVYYGDQYMEVEVDVGDEPGIEYYTFDYVDDWFDGHDCITIFDHGNALSIPDLVSEIAYSIELETGGAVLMDDIDIDASSIPEPFTTASIKRVSGTPADMWDDSLPMFAGDYEGYVSFHTDLSEGDIVEWEYELVNVEDGDVVDGSGVSYDNSATSIEVDVADDVDRNSHGQIRYDDVEFDARQFFASSLSRIRKKGMTASTATKRISAPLHDDTDGDTDVLVHHIGGGAYVVIATFPDGHEEESQPMTHSQALNFGKQMMDHYASRKSRKRSNRRKRAFANLYSSNPDYGVWIYQVDGGGTGLIRRFESDSGSPDYGVTFRDLTPEECDAVNADDYDDLDLHDVTRYVYVSGGKLEFTYTGDYYVFDDYEDALDAVGQAVVPVNTVSASRKRSNRRR